MPWQELKIVGKGKTLVPIISWAGDLDEDTIRQAINLANLPFAYRHVCLMADAHVGYGMPIGGILAAKGHIIPNAVGVDIGCGVRAWCTQVEVERFLPVRSEILAEIHGSIPTGFDWHRTQQTDEIFDRAPRSPVIRKELNRARYQLGTLGGGNHFIEAGSDEQGLVWLMVHSGSRNLGKQVATYYNQVAKNWSEKIRLLFRRHQLACLWWMARMGKNTLPPCGIALILPGPPGAYDATGLTFGANTSPTGPAPVDVHHNYAAYERHWYLAVAAPKGAVGRRPGGGARFHGSTSYIGQAWRIRTFVLAPRCRAVPAGERTISTQEVRRQLEAQDIELVKTKMHDGPRRAQRHTRILIGNAKPAGFGSD